jgi:predicted lactoylglutathione lyase
VQKFFKTFTKKEIADATKSTEVIVSISVDTKAKVEEMTNMALKSGGSPSNPPQDYEWMYQNGFQDLDGHLWELVYIDMSKMPSNMKEQQA